jgi:hypothetical protein
MHMLCISRHVRAITNPCPLPSITIVIIITARHA